MTPEDIIPPWMCFPLKEVSHEAEHPAPAQLPLLCSQSCDTTLSTGSPTSLCLALMKYEQPEKSLLALAT